MSVAQTLRVLRAPGSLEDKIDRAFELIRPAQLKVEVTGLANLVQERASARILEIGRAEGGTLYVLANAAPPGSVIVSIDIVRVGPATRFQLSRFAPGRRVEIIGGDSAASATVDRVRRLLDDRALDLLFIDGDHSYEGVRRDYELWAPLVRPGGVIAFHDIRPGPGSADVHKFWAELQGDKAEIVADPGQASYGIGLLTR